MLLLLVLRFDSVIRLHPRGSTHVLKLNSIKYVPMRTARPLLFFQLRSVLCKMNEYIYYSHCDELSWDCVMGRRNAWLTSRLRRAFWVAWRVEYWFWYLTSLSITVSLLKPNIRLRPFPGSNLFTDLVNHSCPRLAWVPLALISLCWSLIQRISKTCCLDIVTPNSSGWQNGSWRENTFCKAIAF